MIKVKELHKSFGKLDVLKGISTEIKEGEVIATLYTNDEKTIFSAQERLLTATSILDEKPEISPLILKVVN